jgi:hypothetical protein
MAFISIPLLENVPETKIGVEKPGTNMSQYKRLNGSGEGLATARMCSVRSRAQSRSGMTAMRWRIV